MGINKTILVILFFCFGFVAYAQSAKVKGVILDKNNQPVVNVNVSCRGIGTQSNANGYYNITVPENQKVLVVFSHVSLKKVTVSLTLKPNEECEFNLVMSDQDEQMGEIVITANK